MAQAPPKDREVNRGMLTGFETKKVIVGRPGAGVDDTAADRLGQRVHARMRVAEPVDVAITGVYPRTTDTRQTGRWLLI